MAELDEKTNEMLIKNATNTVETSKMTAQLASGSSIKIETLKRHGKQLPTVLRKQTEFRKKQEEQEKKIRSD